MNTLITTTSRRLLAGLLFLAAAAAFGADAVLEYPFVGTYQREAAQGMAIYKDSAFLFNNTGICRIYNLKTRKFVTSFLLDTTAPENHSNCANFGVEFPEGNSSYPALYVSECYGERRCFVEDINAAGAKLIQTLKVRSGGTEDKSFDWYVDREKKYLYTASIVGPGKEKDTLDYLITKLPLPKLSDGDVTFAKKDIIEQFTISFRHLSQGGVIRGDRLYLPVGHVKPTNPKQKDPRDRALIIVNLRTKQIERTLDFSDSLVLEPEDVDFHGDKLLMYCGQSGGLWDVKGF